MLTFAICDDNLHFADSFRRKIYELCVKYVPETIDCRVLGVFTSGTDLKDFMDNNPISVLFLDIDMPVMNGLETAKKIRELGSEMNIYFVTNYASLAIDGYGVGALDFVVKPIKDVDVSRAIEKLVDKINEESSVEKIVIRVKSGYRTIKVNTIKYIEVNTHDV